MPIDRIQHETWVITPGEVEEIVLQWFTGDLDTPDDTADTSTFKLTIRRNPRDTGAPLAFVESGDGIEATDDNEITVTLSEEQTRALIGCKSPMWALQRDGTTVLDGPVQLNFTVVQAGP